MRNRVKRSKGRLRVMQSMGCGALALGLCLQVVPSMAHRGYSESSLRGKWGFFEEFRYGDRYGVVLGIVTFDGAGGCRVLTSTNGGDSTGSTPVKGECAYEIKPSGWGSLSGSAMSPQLRFHFTEHGKAIQFIDVQQGHYGWGEMRPIGTTRVTPATIKGRWAGIHPGVFTSYETTVNTYTFDGVQEATAKWTSHGGPSATNPTEGTLELHYEVRSDGWGTMGADRFVVTNNGTRIFWIHSANGNVGWGELTRP